MYQSFRRLLAGEQEHRRFKLAGRLVGFQIQHPLQILSCLASHVHR
jgi:hypothetical protein